MSPGWAICYQGEGVFFIFWKQACFATGVKNKISSIKFKKVNLGKFMQHIFLVFQIN